MENEGDKITIQTQIDLKSSYQPQQPVPQPLPQPIPQPLPQSYPQPLPQPYPQFGQPYAPPFQPLPPPPPPRPPIILPYENQYNLDRITLGKMLFVLILSMTLTIVAIFHPWFVSEPYDGLTINYYFSYAQYSTDNHKFYYQDCHKEEYKALWCNELINVTDVLQGLLFGSLGCSFLIGVYIIYRMTRVLLWRVTKRELFILMLIVSTVYVVLYFSYLTYLSNWPYTQLCDYSCSLGIFGLFSNNCTCYWGDAVRITIFAAYFLVILFFLIFRSFVLLDTNDFLPLAYQPLDGGPIPPPNNATFCFCSRRTACQFFVANLFILATILHFCTSSNEVTDWNNPTRNAQGYIDNLWQMATCLNDSNYYYSHPAVTYYEQSCSFPFPGNWDVTGDLTYYDCCTAQTCDIAFDYIAIFDYVVDTNCYIDMEALTKASCHPLNKYFVGDKFDITLSPSEKHNAGIVTSDTNSVAICYLYCQQIYDDCKGSYLSSHPTMNVEKYYNGSAEAFCTDALGVVVRYEVFTDQCFGASARFFNGKYIFVFVIFLSFLAIC